MNQYQQDLYAALMKLADERDAFYFQDFELDDRVYRIFNYRMASYTDFCEPFALECRGTMFEMKTPEDFSPWVPGPVRLAALPMHKFFNLNENPFTMNLDLSQTVGVMEKADGSLISTYTHNGSLRLKSKGSVASDQCIAAMKWLAEDEHFNFYCALVDWTGRGYTVNMEWCSPDNRIVLGYEQPHLEVLNIRNRQNGEYLFADDIESDSYLLEFWTNVVTIGDPVEFVEKVPALTGIEGFVVRTPDIWFKLKTDWYLSLHRLKDSINSPRRLFEAVLDEATDDLRASFHDDPLALKQIADMEEYVIELYHEMAPTVETFYWVNKNLDRKEYAIKGQQELKPMYFSLAMQKYTGREPDYKGFLKKQWKRLGLKDEVESNEDD